MSTAATAAPEAKAQANLSDRAKGERSLGWKLAGPAFIVMLLVTLYPIAYAVYLSLFNYRLTDPDNREFVGLNNYVVSFSDSVFWSAMLATVIITVITVVRKTQIIRRARIFLQIVSKVLAFVAAGAAATRKPAVCPRLVPSALLAKLALRIRSALLHIDFLPLLRS